MSNTFLESKVSKGQVFRKLRLPLHQSAQQVYFEEEEVGKIPTLWCYRLGLS